MWPPPHVLKLNSFNKQIKRELTAALKGEAHPEGTTLPYSLASTIHGKGGQRVTRDAADSPRCYAFSDVLPKLCFSAFGLGKIFISFSISVSHWLSGFPLQVIKEGKIPHHLSFFKKKLRLRAMSNWNIRKSICGSLLCVSFACGKREEEEFCKLSRKSRCLVPDTLYISPRSQLLFLLAVCANCHSVVQYL